MPETPQAPRHRWTMAFLFLTVLLDSVGFGIVIPIVPALLQDVGNVPLADAARVSGFLFAGYALAQFLSGPLMGNLSDAFGRRPLLLVAIGGLMVDYLFCAIAPSLPLLYAGRLVAGACGASYVIANACIADIKPPEERAGAFGVLGAGFGVGFVLGPALGGLLGEFGSRVPFLVAAAVSGLNFLLGALVLPETLSRDARRPFVWRRSNPFGVFRVFGSYRRVWPLALTLGLFAFGTSVYPAIWAFWGKARFGWSEAMIGLTLAAFGLTQALTQGLLAGRLASWLGESGVARLGLWVSIGAALGYAFVDSLPWLLLLLVLHAPEGLVHPMLTGILSREVPEDAQGELQGGLSSVMSLTMLLGTLFFSQLFAALTDPGAEFQAASGPFLVTALLGVGVVALFERSAPPAPTP